jgi:hypothetical protein
MYENNLNKGMTFKHVPPLSVLIGLIMVTSCTIDGVVGAPLLVPISTNMKLSDSYLKSKKAIRYAYSSNW